MIHARIQRIFQAAQKADSLKEDELGYVTLARRGQGPKALHDRLFCRLIVT